MIHDDTFAAADDAAERLRATIARHQSRGSIGGEFLDADIEAVLDHRDGLAAHVAAWDEADLETGADPTPNAVLGVTRYGTPLQPHNGRDALRDAYEEALDLVHYLRQAIYERDNPDSCPDCDHLLASHYTGTEMKIGCGYPDCSCQRSIPRTEGR